jgi:hypothetical protein
VKYLWLPLVFAAVQPATASIYANLETREVIGVKDGKPLVVISDGKDIVETANPKAETPTGTKDLKDGQKLKVPMNEAGFKYYSSLFERLRAAEGAHEKCLEARDYQGCVASFTGEMTEYEKESLRYQRRHAQSLDQLRREERGRAAFRFIFADWF